MKKLLSMMVIAGMSLSLVACQGTAKEDTPSTQAESQATDDQNTDIEQPDSQASDDTTGDDINTENTTDDGSNSDDGSANSGDTVGSVLKAAFFDTVEQFDSTPDANAQAIAEAVLNNPINDFGGAAMPVEPGLLNGFDNAEITGFSEGVMFAPMIGSIPFVGYVFTLDEGTNADEFVQNLKDNANPRWNVCTEADETVIEQSGNFVFFLMCPKSFDE